MNGGGHRYRRETLNVAERDAFYASTRRNQAKRRTKARAQQAPSGFQLEIVEKKIAWPFLHRKFTNHQQDFHSLLPTCRPPFGGLLLGVPCYP
jgi:hypothetical protein